MSDKGNRPDIDDPTANEEGLPRGDAVLTEQRRNLDRQVTTLREIDQTAARAVRIAAIIVGFVTTAATAVSQTGSSPTPSTLLLTGLGIVFLLATMVLGVLTLGETAYKTRLTDGEYMRLSKPYPPDGSERVALRKYHRSWSAEISEVLDNNSERLAGVQRSLILGVVLVAASGFAQLYGRTLGKLLLQHLDYAVANSVVLTGVVSALCSLLVVGVTTLLALRVVL
ncbi:hypothetical protein [Halobaculum sp. MBLA0143]|uniref:hypothetical protein n=1 Tax=Halobaculum sp. MBLA0143 TaxID=3079933 RepID=UPI003525E14C